MANLSLVRNMLAKERLMQRDLEILMGVTYELVNYSATWDPGIFAKRRLVDVKEPAARLFLAVDTVYAACEAVGPAMKRPEWWGSFMARVPTRPVYLFPAGSAGGFTASFLTRIFNALDIYRSGKRPPEKHVVAIKTTIFQLPCFHWKFRKACWDPWRHDAGLPSEPP